MIVVQLLRWVNHLMSFGRSSATTRRIEDAAATELNARLSIPYLGAHPWRGDAPPEGAKPILAQEVGYLKFLDISVLSDLCEEHGLEVYLPCNTGAMLYEDTPLALGPWHAGC